MAETAKTSSDDQGLEVHAAGLPYELDEGLGQRARIGLIVLACIPLAYRWWRGGDGTAGVGRP